MEPIEVNELSPQRFEKTEEPSSTNQFYDKLNDEIDLKQNEFEIIDRNDSSQNLSKTLDLDLPNQKQTLAKRKQNMFANDPNIIINYDLLSDISATEQPSDDQSHPHLTKSKTFDRSLSMVEFLVTVQDDDDDESIRCIDSISLESVEMRESRFDSDNSNETVFTRANSWESIESNVLFKRSQSTFSELEYIKGRDDCRHRRSIMNDQIDSDNYHHHRRFSEDADNLEFIRGREDWLKNEMHLARSNTLPILFEHGNRKFLIQDEIDSDEYHHNFYLCEALRTATELDQRFLSNQSQSPLPYKGYKDEADQRDYLHRYDWKKESLALNALLDKRSRSKSRDRESKDSLSTSREPSDDKSEGVEINKVLNNIIDANILQKDSLEKSPTEDIEIMILDLNENKESKALSNDNNNPLIIITEASEDHENSLPDADSFSAVEEIHDRKLSAVDETFKANQEIVPEDFEDSFVKIETPLSEDETNSPKKENMWIIGDSEADVNEIDQIVSPIENVISISDGNISLIDEGRSSLNQHSAVKKENIASTDVHASVIDENVSLKSEDFSVINANILAKEENNLSKSTNSENVSPIKQLNDQKLTENSIKTPNEIEQTSRKKRQTKIQDNFEDLIRDGSLGIWFHK